MKQNLGRWLALTTLLLVGSSAQAVISCNVTSPGISAAYSPASVGNTFVQTSFTVNCSRAATDPTTVTYYVVPNNGSNTGNNPNRAMRAGSIINYDTYRNSTCTTLWTANFTDYIGGTITFGTGSQTQSYWGCISPGQNTPAGTYTDTVTMTVYYGASYASSTSTFPVTINTPATCSISGAPGPVAFGAYVAYGGPLGASSTFRTTCTQFLPYTVSVSPPSGVIAGLTYNLLLQNAAPVMSGTSLSVTGSGVQQTYTINGSMAAGQSGVCAAGTCSGTVPHTITLTY